MLKGTERMKEEWKNDVVSVLKKYNNVSQCFQARRFCDNERHVFSLIFLSAWLYITWRRVPELSWFPMKEKTEEKNWNRVISRVPELSWFPWFPTWLSYMKKAYSC
jgi:hypothetical protein